MTTYISQGMVATDLRGGDSFNSNFLHRSLTNLMVKNYEKFGPLCRSYSASKLSGKFWHTLYRMLYNEHYKFPMMMMMMMMMTSHAKTQNKSNSHF